MVDEVKSNIPLSTIDSANKEPTLEFTPPKLLASKKCNTFLREKRKTIEKMEKYFLRRSPL